MEKQTVSAGDVGNLAVQGGELKAIQKPAPLGFVFGENPERDIRRLAAAIETLARWDEKKLDKSEHRALLARQVTVLSAVYPLVATALAAGKSLLDVLRVAFPERYPTPAPDAAPAAGEG
jgi:hypothetical protein